MIRCSFGGLDDILVATGGEGIFIKLKMVILLFGIEI